MSWQPYIDNLVASPHLEKAAIFGEVTGATGSTEISDWAHSNDFNLSSPEMKAIWDVLIDNGDAREKAYGEGLQLAGEQFAVIRIDESEKSLALRCKVSGKEKHGVCIGKANKSVIAGYYDGSTTQAGNANETVLRMVKYLDSVLH